MAKSKTFKANHDGSIFVDVGEGRKPVHFTGGSYTTDDPVEIAALEANSDVSEVKSSSKPSKK